MRVETLALRNVRNYGEASIEFAPRANVLCGLNGQGKTSVLEAISLCALSTTFVPCDDKALVRRGEESCSASASARTDLLTPYKVSVTISTRERKRIASSLGKRLAPQDIIGEMPVVALSPDFKAITAGAPADRRRFMDSVLSQASKSYMKDMLALKRILRQRNALLHAAKHGERVDAALLESWTESLARVSASLALKRREFAREFGAYASAAYAEVSGGKETPEMRYAPDAIERELLENAADARVFETAYREAFAKALPSERKRGTTALGPQKDEILFFINGGVARESASQGQHKTLLIALKTAEFRYLRDARAETPLLLLDDVFSELDALRAENVFSLFRSDAQIFITTTDPAMYRRHFDAASGDHALFAVENGAARRSE